MTTPSESPFAGERYTQIVRNLYEQGGLEGIPYAGITLESPGFTTAYARDAVLSQRIMTSLWPGLSPSDNECESVFFADECPENTVMDELTAAREGIIQAKVYSPHFAGIAERDRSVWEARRKAIEPVTPYEAALIRSAVKDVPVGIVVMSQVLESTVSEAGDRMLHMWYPYDGNPKSVLVGIRQAVRRSVEQEKML